MNESDRNKELLKSAIPLQINIVVSNPDDNKQWLTELICIKKCNCKHENNSISSSSVDANNEEWTGWLFWKTYIGVVTDNIMSW